jgi:hypothetical protein
MTCRHRCNDDGCNPFRCEFGRSGRHLDCRMRARCAMMDTRCSDGCRLKSTTSPSCRWRSTTSPTCTGFSVQDHSCPISNLQAPSLCMLPAVILQQLHVTGSLQRWRLQRLWRTSEPGALVSRCCDACASRKTQGSAIQGRACCTP